MTPNNLNYLPGLGICKIKQKNLTIFYVLTRNSSLKVFKRVFFLIKLALKKNKESGYCKKH